VQLSQAIAHTEVDQLTPFARLAEALGHAGLRSGALFAKAG